MKRILSRFTIEFCYFPIVYHFGFSIGYYEELEAYAFGLNIGSGGIIIGFKK